MTDPTDYDPTKQKCSGHGWCDEEAIRGERFCTRHREEMVRKGRNPYFLPGKTERHRWPL